MRRISVSIWIALLSLFVLSCVAFASISPPPIMNTDELGVGIWAKYQQKENGKTVDVWFGVVGEEKIDGKRYVWIETRINLGGQNIIAKALMRIAVGENVSDIKKIVFKMGNQPAMEISSDMLNMMSQMGQNVTPFSPTEGGENAKIKVVGKEKIKVPAGTFVAKHIRIINKNTKKTVMDVWEANKVPVKIVKVKMKTGGEVVLLGYGNGAKSKITETPVPFSMQNLMNMNMNTK